MIKSSLLYYFSNLLLFGVIAGYEYAMDKFDVTATIEDRYLKWGREMHHLAHRAGDERSYYFDDNNIAFAELRKVNEITEKVLDTLTHKSDKWLQHRTGELHKIIPQLSHLLVLYYTYIQVLLQILEKYDFLYTIEPLASSKYHQRYLDSVADISVLQNKLRQALSTIESEKDITFDQRDILKKEIKRIAMTLADYWYKSVTSLANNLDYQIEDVE